MNRFILFFLYLIFGFIFYLFSIHKKVLLFQNLLIKMPKFIVFKVFISIKIKLIEKI